MTFGERLSGPGRPGQVFENNDSWTSIENLGARDVWGISGQEFYVTSGDGIYRVGCQWAAGRWVSRSSAVRRTPDPKRFFDSAECSTKAASDRAARSWYSPPVIRLVNVHCSFDGVRALAGLSLHVPEGAFLGVIGPGGSGKSTLCRVVCGLERPAGGVAIVGGVDLMRAGPGEIRSLQARCGMQFQNDALFEHMSVLDNVRYPLRRLTSLPEVEIEGRAVERLAMVGLAGLERRLPNRLSGGQRRRVALARACVTDPELLICDDPTAGLDPVTSRRILDMIAGIRFQVRNTVVLSSSDVVGTLSVAERMALVWDGMVIEEGTASSFQSSARREVRRFLDDARLPAEVAS